MIALHIIFSLLIYFLIVLTSYQTGVIRTKTNIIKGLTKSIDKDHDILEVQETVDDVTKNKNMAYLQGRQEMRDEIYNLVK